MVAHFDIAGIFEIFAIAAGFIILHKAKKEQEPLFLKIAGITLIAGGVLIGLCTAYYSVVYGRAGYFHYPGMMGPRSGMYMNPGNMQMGPGMMQGTTPMNPGGMMQGNSPMNQGNMPMHQGGMMQGR